LGIPRPDYHLAIGSGTHGEQTGRMLAALEEVILERSPDVVLVYGDTNSTLAGALAAAKLHIPIAHVEAGLRSFNRRMPEEINRVVTDHLSNLLFAPTTTAVLNLAAEGIAGERVAEVGDVMYDLALLAGRRADAESSALSALGVEHGNYLLATIHRAENTDHADRLLTIMRALAELAKAQPVLLPLHPRTRSAIDKHRVHELPQDLRLIDPVGYLDMVALERGAKLILTDSGGVQKEAYFHGVPCVTLRCETEWVELVEAGWNTLAPPTAVATIVESARHAMASVPSERPTLYGDGDSAERITRKLLERYSGQVEC
jgi:UDP-GlcNAc3NAcA epimerase